MKAPRHKPARHQLKRPTEIDHGHICEVEPTAGSGCIETRDGRIIRFYKESLENNTIERLTTGTH